MRSHIISADLVAFAAPMYFIAKRIEPKERTKSESAAELFTDSDIKKPP